MKSVGENGPRGPPSACIGLRGLPSERLASARNAIGRRFQAVHPERGASREVADSNRPPQPTHRLTVLWRSAAGARTLSGSGDRWRAVTIANSCNRLNRPTPERSGRRQVPRRGGRPFRLSRAFLRRRLPGFSQANAGAAGVAAEPPRADCRSRPAALFRDVNGSPGPRAARPAPSDNSRRYWRPIKAPQAMANAADL